MFILLLRNFILYFDTTRKKGKNFSFCLTVLATILIIPGNAIKMMAES
jgi:hypothetical protein